MAFLSKDQICGLRKMYSEIFRDESKHLKTLYEKTSSDPIALAECFELARKQIFFIRFNVTDTEILKRLDDLLFSTAKIQFSSLLYEFNQSIFTRNRIRSDILEVMRGKEEVMQNFVFWHSQISGDDDDFKMVDTSR